ncbi:hypothetical protein IC615_07240 [Serratia ureilytica]
MEQAKSLTTEFALFDAFRVRFNRAQNSILQSVEARSKDRLQNLTNTLQTRKNRELADISNVLNELERTITAELAKDQQPMQFSLFSEDERIQLRRDNAALKLVLRAYRQSANRKYKLLKLATPKLMTALSGCSHFFLVPESSIQRGVV